jgi:hypothetical protein
MAHHHRGQRRPVEHMLGRASSYSGLWHGGPIIATMEGSSGAAAGSHHQEPVANGPALGHTPSEHH